MPYPFRPVLEAVEDRLTPAWSGPIPDGAVLVPAPGGGGQVRIINPLDGTDFGTFQPFSDGFSGDVRFATGDVTGDGAPDLIVAAGPGGGPRVRVFDGKTGDVVADFFAFEGSFRGGVYVAAGDVNRDGHADIIVGAGEGGGPVVRVFDGSNPAGMLNQFFAFEPNFRGGVRVAAGAGGAPRVTVFNALSGAEVTTFLAYDGGLRGGVYVTTAGAGSVYASADRTLGMEAKVVTGPGDGGGPLVKEFSGTTGEEYFSYLVGDGTSRTGLQVWGNSVTLVAGTPTPTGVSLVAGPWTGYQTYWTLPPGDTLITGTIETLDPTTGVITLSSGQQLMAEPNTVVRLFGTDVPLSSIQPGYPASVVVSAAGRLVRLDATTPVATIPPIP
ncbi:MAG TPA: VCBS repeat-containing protein [Urbifossiella sp.]|jgi:hypothetical protein|nr:VCBS repeat-containing protein [Urbifossiella sp.]